jgi:hypothetical protein
MSASRHAYMPSTARLNSLTILGRPRVDSRAFPEDHGMQTQNNAQKVFIHT